MPRPKMPGPDNFTMLYDGEDMYLAADGVKIAKRSKGNTWISLEPGWRILDKPDSITIDTPPRGPNDYANSVITSHSERQSMVPHSNVRV